MTPGERSRAAGGLGWVETTPLGGLPARAALERSRPPAIIAGLSARDLDRLSLPPRGKLVEIRPMGKGWAIRARCGCGCGATVRAVYALTVPAAVWRFRFARREAVLVEEALAP